MTQRAAAWGAAWRSPAAQSIAWQAVGSAATLAAALWVSWRFGLAAQGEFGYAKSWFDAAAACAALGLPQGLLHLQYRLRLNAADVWPVCLRTGAALTVAAVLGAGLMLLMQRPLAVAVLASLPFAVGHLWARSLLLAQRGVVVFGAVTAWPALCVVMGIALMDALQLPRHYALMLWGAAAVSGSASIAWAAKCSRQAVPTQTDWPRRELWQASAQSWLQAALGALLAAALLSTVAALGHGGSALGAASLGLHMYQLFNVGAGYLAPVLYDRLARLSEPSLPHRGWMALLRPLAWGAVTLSVVGVVVALQMPAWSPVLLPLSLMLPAGMAAVAARVAGTVLLARGDYVELSLQAAARLVVAVGCTALALRALPAAAAVALALLVTELATWWRSHRLARTVPQ